MKTNITLMLLITLALSACSKHYCKKGDSYYKTMQYDKAINNYSKGLKKEPSTEVKTKLADSYRLNNDYKNAEKWYAQLAVTPNTEAINFFYYGKVLMNNGKYKEAKREFLNYLVLTDTDAVADVLIASCDSCNKFYSDSSQYELKAVQIPNLTSSFGQVKFNDGLVFAADCETCSQKKNGWTGRSYLDLYFSSKMADGTWTNPEPLKGEINGPFHEGPAVFNSEKNKIFFTRSNYSGRKKLQKNEQDESNLKVFSAELKDGIWTNLNELPFNSDEYSCGHPTLSADEKTIYFISDMPNGLGGTDIYKVTKIKNKEGIEEWSTPENLGKTINTSGNEMFPYVHKNGILYFSSDAHNTLGGLDIFSSSYENKKWSEPENLNYPINSSKDDFAFVLNDDDKTGYISSNRNDLDKIYEIKLPDPEFMLIGRVTEKENGKALMDAMVEITNSKDTFIQLISTDDFGHYSMKLKAGTEYKVRAIMDGYLKVETITVSTEEKKKSETFKVNFQLEKIQLEKAIVIENIYYDLDKWEIRKDAALELDKFIVLLNNNPQLSIEMDSHTDARANDQYNQILSDKRAKATVEYLVKKGIDLNRLKWKGYGESVLINKCGNGVVCEEKEHQQNRRTEFKILKVSELASKSR